MLEVHQFPCLSDNYGFLVHDPESTETACIDTPDADAYLREAARCRWQITHIWNTHWHPDHAGGNAAIKAATGCKVIAPAAEAEKIEGVDRAVRPGDVVCLGDWEAAVIDVGGHTSGHIAYYIPGAGMAFVGDSLFALGCGRMFEGTPEQFWASLARLKALPPSTTLYCAHEYTASNARFALHADPDNPTLRKYAERVTAQRARGEPTVPTSLARELPTNPFLRADDPAMQARWGGGNADFVAAEAGIRQLHARYVDAVFRKDFAAFGDCFTDDAEWRIAGQILRGRPRIVGFLERVMDNFHRVIMTFRTPILNLEGRTALARTYVTENNGFKSGRPGFNIGTYYERLVADESGVWRRSWALYQLHYMGPSDLTGSFFEQPDYGAPPAFPPGDATTVNYSKVGGNKG
ncbi:MAG: hydroxyacylglutathione hydrolase [Novosphingobium sp.]|nr:hydroxyacylglutathione hydrolase [Novosphingobium sp.]